MVARLGDGRRAWRVGTSNGCGTGGVTFRARRRDGGDRGIGFGGGTDGGTGWFQGVPGSILFIGGALFAKCDT
jgi:hypothetical protein